MVEGVRLAGLVGSKVCHEVAGPFTGILHAMEMLKAEPGARNSEALALLEQGLVKLFAKVDFLRGAFAASEADQPVPLAEARRLAEPLYATLKPELAWRAPELVVPRSCLRVFMYLLLLGADCLPKGGVVAVEAEQNGVLEIRAVATGPRAGLRAAVAEALLGDTPAASVQADVIIPVLTRLIARQHGYEIVSRAAPERIELAMRAPRHPRKRAVNPAQRGS